MPEGVPSIAGLHELLGEFGGASFGQGLYRIIATDDFSAWRDRLALGFPAFRHAVPFGFDWLGRLFALDGHRLEDGEPGVIIVEPGTGEVLQVPVNIFSFHDGELVEYPGAALANDYFDAWIAEGNPALGPEECAGYKVPLFFGGVDDASNIERSDIDVYWHIMCQLIEVASSR